MSEGDDPGWIRPPSPGASVAPSYHTFAPGLADPGLGPGPAAAVPTLITAVAGTHTAPVGIYRQFCAAQPSTLEVRSSSWLRKPIRVYDDGKLAFTYRLRTTRVMREYALCNTTGQAYCTVSRHPFEWEMHAHTAQSHQPILTLRKPDANWLHLLLLFRDLVGAANDPPAPDGRPAWSQWELIHQPDVQTWSARTCLDGPNLAVYRVSGSRVQIFVAQGVDTLLAGLVGCILVQDGESLRSQGRRNALSQSVNMVSGGWANTGAAGNALF